MSDPSQPVDPAAQQAPADQTGILEVKTSFFFLAFILYLFPAKASIDGSADINQGWGTKHYPMPAGRHQIRVWSPYLGLFRMGDALHEVDVYPGQITTVDWACPWFVWSAGKWATLGVRPMDAAAALPTGTPPVQTVPTTGPPEAAVAASGTPAGWHPDPQGQAPLRWWDGQQWTEHTSDGQATG